MDTKQYLKLGLKTIREIYALERLMEEDLTISQIAFEGLSKVSLTAIIDRFEELRPSQASAKQAGSEEDYHHPNRKRSRCPSTLRHQHGIEVKQWRQSSRLC